MSLRSISLPSKSKGNYKIQMDKTSSKLIFTFPDNAELSRGISEFKTEEDLLKYASSSLGAEINSKSLRGSVVRKGKYQKVDKSGNPVLTIGDPILDLISDDNGRIVIAGQAMHLTANEFNDPRYRSGGLRSIDLSQYTKTLSQSQLVSAARGEGDFTLIEASDRVLSFASKNPSQLDFFPASGGHLRFKAWKKRYVFYWSMGAEIETWGGNFKTARIESRYIDTFFAQVCAVVKTDSDSDTNDDYVDEYEWGVNAPQPKRVESLCTAQFKGQTFNGGVQAGSECFVLT